VEWRKDAAHRVVAATPRAADYLTAAIREGKANFRGIWQKTAS
jgi:hypothetical protein